MDLETGVVRDHDFAGAAKVANITAVLKEVHVCDTCEKKNIETCPECGSHNYCDNCIKCDDCGYEWTGVRYLGEGNLDKYDVQVKFTFDDDEVRDDVLSKDLKFGMSNYTTSSPNMFDVNGSDVIWSMDPYHDQFVLSFGSMGCDSYYGNNTVYVDDVFKAIGKDKSFNTINGLDVPVIRSGETGAKLYGNRYAVNVSFDSDVASSTGVLTVNVGWGDKSWDHYQYRIEYMVGDAFRCDVYKCYHCNYSVRANDSSIVPNEYGTIWCPSCNMGTLELRCESNSYGPTSNVYVDSYKLYKSFEFDASDYVSASVGHPMDSMPYVHHEVHGWSQHQNDTYRYGGYDYGQHDGYVSGQGSSVLNKFTYCGTDELGTQVYRAYACYAEEYYSPGPSYDMLTCNSCGYQTYGYEGQMCPSCSIGYLTYMPW